MRRNAFFKRGYFLSILVRLGPVLMLLVAALGVAPVPVVHAATITVDTTDDELNNDGDCSLREAIRAANTNVAVDACPAGEDGNPDMITLANHATYTLSIGGEDDTAQQGDLDIIDNTAATDLVIQVAGDGLATIDGGGIDRVLHILSGATVTISGVTIQHGSSSEGGGIYNSGTLTMNDSTVSNNISVVTHGGGIYNLGTMTLNNSTVSDNHSNSLGGGIYNRGTLTVNNSTVSGNFSSLHGGGIRNLYGTAALNNSTVSNNTAGGGSGGGGIRNSSGTVNIRNTIIAGNTDLTGQAPDCGDAPPISQDYNLLGNNTGCVFFVAQPHDQVGTAASPLDPRLLPLADNGGSTQTHALQPASPAVDAGSCGGATADQRGYPRPVDIPGTANVDVGCDIGAYEAQPQLSLTKTVDDDAPDPGQFITYMIVVKNSGVLSATDALISDHLPSGLNFVGPVTLDPPGAGTTGAPPTLVSSLTVGAGEGITVTLPVTVNTGLSGGTVITNTAAVASAELATPTSGAVEVTVNNVAPMTVDDSGSTTADTPLTLSVLANDSDPNGDALSVTSVGVPNYGSTAISSITQITYTPANRSVSYTAVFTYTASDGSLTDTATVAVTVSPVNAAPIFTSTPVTAATENVAYVYNVTVADVDTGDVLTITAPILPGWLTLTDHGDGTATLSGTPANADIGDHGVMLEVTDGVEIASQSFTIAVSEKATHYVYLPLVVSNYVAAPDLIVESITATSNSVQVVVKNVGHAPVADEFWVDGYINPNPVPTGVNQTWDMLASQGLVWGVSEDALPLAPGDVITLTVGDDYYWPEPWSQVSWPLSEGTPVYAQVDSANAQTTYGAVLEMHEIVGGTYNNIAGTVSALGVEGETISSVGGKERPALPGGLPPRR